MDSFTRFNIFEGIFWLGLGIISLILNQTLAEKYRKLSLVSAVVFLLFGLSDFIEIKTAGFLPDSPWLLIWKVANVVGIVVVIVWYFKIRVKA